jgi:Glycosyl transferase family 2/Dolichyl-phosphate-mannose-protein mannosyltransferase
MTATIDPPAGDGITVVLPAYREEANLASTVDDMLETLAAMGERHCVIVVNDGSPDATGAVAEDLAALYPDRVRVVHHEVNRGYGAAVRTGIRAALEETDSGRLFLTDSDGQFRAAQLPEFLDLARNERADAVIGFRPRRADPLQRKVNAFLWGHACKLLLRIRAHDVDCAYKLIDRRVLDGAPLRGDAGTISPELIVRLRARGARIMQRPVDHFPRQHGEQTGAKLSVIAKSLVGLVVLWLERLGEGWPGHVARRIIHPRDPALAALTVASGIASVIAYLYFVSRHAVLAYPDATSHLLIARRVIDASSPGVAQLGAVWLPLPHLLTVPVVWIGSWYYSGFAGSIVSMVAYVVATRYVYKTSYGLTGNRAAGLVSGTVFAANPNVLYLQSTPMTELLLIACIAATVYYLMRWCQSGSYLHLAATAAAALLGTLARYEAWVVDAAVVAVVLWVAWQRAPGLGTRERWRHAEAHMIFYGVLAFSGIAGWLLWNAVIFRSPLYFQTGTFAKPSLWVSHTDLAVGHLGVAALTYLYAMADNLGWLAIGLGSVGCACYLIRGKLRAESMAPITLLIIIPFYAYALYSGQRPLHVAQINGSLYNVRFGILTVLPAAIFIGYLVPIMRRMSWPRWPTVGQAALWSAAVASVAIVFLTGIPTLQEPQAYQASASQQANDRAALWLRGHYRGGAMLMESFGNETVTFESRIPLRSIIYEGSYRQWQPALRDPFGHGIRWIYMRRTAGDTDDVWNALHSRPELSRYTLVYRDADRLIYTERPSR